MTKVADEVFKYTYGLFYKKCVWCKLRTFARIHVYVFPTDASLGAKVVKSVAHHDCYKEKAL